MATLLREFQTGLAVLCLCVLTTFAHSKLPLPVQEHRSCSALLLHAGPGSERQGHDCEGY